MVYKILGAIIILAAGTLAFLTLKEDSTSLFSKKKNNSKSEVACIQLTPAEQLVKLIDDDFKRLETEQQLPPQWKSISTIEYRIGSELARVLLGKAKPGIQRVQNGSAYLEVEVMDLPDETNPGIILQASLFDIKSKNKIFEIGRTYTMNDLNHQTPPEPTSNQTPQQGRPQASASNYKDQGDTIHDKPEEPKALTGVSAPMQHQAPAPQGTSEQREGKSQ